MSIAKTLTDLGLKFEDTGSVEYLFFYAPGQTYGERIQVAVIVNTGEIDVVRQYDEVTEKPSLTIRWSAWDASLGAVLERWVS